VNRKIAKMHAPDPDTFAMFKHWLSEQSEYDPTKKPRDQRQANAVRFLVAEFMPHMPLSELGVFPHTLQNLTAAS
jgi:uncharacterized NAD(P)/FAD-binding protein YdhS